MVVNAGHICRVYDLKYALNLGIARQPGLHTALLHTCQSAKTPVFVVFRCETLYLFRTADFGELLFSRLPRTSERVHMDMEKADEGPPDGESHESVAHWYETLLDIYFDDEPGFIVCRHQNQSLLTIDSLRRHCTEKHNPLTGCSSKKLALLLLERGLFETSKSFNKDMYDVICKEMQRSDIPTCLGGLAVKDSHKTYQGTPKSLKRGHVLPAIANVAVFHGKQCPDCLLCSPEETMVKHMKRDHGKDQGDLNELVKGFPLITMQKLSGRSAYFPVRMEEGTEVFNVSSQYERERNRGLKRRLRDFNVIRGADEGADDGDLLRLKSDMDGTTPPGGLSSGKGAQIIRSMFSMIARDEGGYEEGSGAAMRCVQKLRILSTIAMNKTFSCDCAALTLFSPKLGIRPWIKFLLIWWQQPSKESSQEVVVSAVFGENMLPSREWKQVLIRRSKFERMLFTTCTK